MGLTLAAGLLLLAGAQLAGTPIDDRAERLLGLLVGVGALWVALGTVARRTDRATRPAVVAALVACTPVVLFLVGIGDPAGIVAAGALVLWAGLVADPPGRTGYQGPAGRAAPAAVLLGWATMVFTSIDGLLVAPVVAILVTSLSDRSLVERWGALARVERVLLAVATAAGIGLAVFRGEAGSFATGEGWAPIDERLSTTVGGIVPGVVEAPLVAVFGWWLLVGLLAAPAVVAGRRRVAIASGAAVGLFLVTPRPIEALLVLAVVALADTEAPLVWPRALARRAPTSPEAPTGRVDPRMWRVVLVGWAAVISVSVLQALRTWGAGADGSMWPGDWDPATWPVRVEAILAAHVVGLVLVLAAVGWGTRAPGATRAGVNLVGYHHASSGLGEIARILHRCLLDAGVPVEAIDVAATASPTRREADTAPETPWYDTTILVVTALELPGVAATHPNLLAGSDVVVGYWFWELAAVPPAHLEAVPLVDEVWAPTRFVHDAYARALAGSAHTEVPVELVPVHLPRPTPAVADREALGWSSHGLDPDAFVFLVTFDHLSVVARKNPMGAIEAFALAFGTRRRTASSDPGEPERPVQLLVKTINGDLVPEAHVRLLEEAARHPGIVVWDEHLEHHQQTALIEQVDVLVSLHRGEGLGLQLADALWLGTPVLASRWSGSLDVVDDTCAALVDVELVPVRDGGGAYPEDATWAEPSVVQAAGWMQLLVSEPDVGAALAEAGRRRMAHQSDPAEFGRLLAARLEVARARVRDRARGLDGPSVHSGRPAGPDEPAITAAAATHPG
jgi:glycosyltransferase involved in cell wall biosynthesis